VASRYRSTTDPEFLLDAPVIAHELPHRVRAALVRFHHGDDAPVLVLGGHLTPSDGALGPTPGHWRFSRPVNETVHRTECLFVLYSSLLGDLFGWGTQQDGRLVHDVVPVAGHEDEQLGSGSRAPLMWHTEEAFHPCRADYVGLMCLRNPDRVATTVGCLSAADLTVDDLACAFEPRFYIRPDNSHLPSYNPELADRRSSQFGKIERMAEAPDPVPILFGSRQDPFLQIDPAYMGTAPGDRAAERALGRVAAAIERSLRDLVLSPADVCFIDNYRAVHGRRPFHARHDGTDRWLKRVNVTRDIRKSSGIRDAASVRVIA